MKSLVKESKKIDILPKYIKNANYIRFEEILYNIARSICNEYSGGVWEMWELSNDSFYMAPEKEGTIKVFCGSNMYDGVMTWDAFGIVCCLLALNFMAWDLYHNEASQSAIETCNNLFYRLKIWVADNHPEAVEIFKAID